MQNIVHLGRGRTIVAEHGNYIDLTVSRPRGGVVPTLRLEALRRLKPPLPARAVRPDHGFIPGTLLEMRAGQCRYPIDEHLFCGAPSVNGKSWCGAHDDLVHGRQKPVDSGVDKNTCDSSSRA